jgi:hypothetical protein
MDPCHQRFPAATLLHPRIDEANRPELRKPTGSLNGRGRAGVEDSHAGKPLGRRDVHSRRRLPGAAVGGIPRLGLDIDPL